MAASSGPHEPPLGLEAQVRESTRQQRANPPPRAADEIDEVETALIEVVAQPLPAADFSILMLTWYEHDPPLVVGGLILQQAKPAALEPGFLEDLASALSESAA